MGSPPDGGAVVRHHSAPVPGGPSRVQSPDRTGLGPRAHSAVDRRVAAGAHPRTPPRASATGPAQSDARPLPHPDAGRGFQCHRPPSLLSTRRRGSLTSQPIATVPVAMAGAAAAGGDVPSPPSPPVKHRMSYGCRTRRYGTPAPRPPCGLGMRLCSGRLTSERPTSIGEGSPNPTPGPPRPK